MSSANQVFKNHEIHNFRIQEAYALLKAQKSKWTDPSSILNATQRICAQESLLIFFHLGKHLIERGMKKKNRSFTINQKFILKKKDNKKHVAETYI